MPIPLVVAGIGTIAGALSERYGLPVPNYRDFTNFPETGKVANVEANALVRAKQILVQEEGRRDKVYKDSLGFLTVGIGHKVVPADKLKLGDVITNAKIDEFFSKDIAVAFNAAITQAKELGKYNVEMIARLTSVNFQLGIYWRTKFPNTWSLLKNGEIKKAIANIQSSAWAKQTPTRVSMFVTTLINQYS